ncbi:hypothetical protein QSH57_004391 [Fusarium oxysporum f. sp. vasinfectum]|nr:hypothetical protein QSH57_004391 [Fusarium oxysporum f. sp. vasinfectum]
MSPAQATVLSTNGYKAELATDAELVTKPKRGTAFDHLSRRYQARNWASPIDNRSADLRFFTLSLEAEGESITNWSLCMLTVLSGGYKERISHNKPDKPDQANMTPEDVVLGHAQYFNVYGVVISIGPITVSDIILESVSIWWLSDLFEVSSRLKPFYEANFCPDYWCSLNIQLRDQWLPDTLNYYQKACEACDGSSICLLELVDLGNDGIIKKGEFPEKGKWNILAYYFIFA